ncbi:hypothetical protein AVEN_32787-1, partial [Araneus ventricosus]
RAPPPITNLPISASPSVAPVSEEASASPDFTDFKLVTNRKKLKKDSPTKTNNSIAKAEKISKFYTSRREVLNTIPTKDNICTRQSALKSFETKKPLSVDTQLLPMAVLPPLEKTVLQSRESDADAEMSSSSLSEEDALEYDMSEDLEDSPAVNSPPPSSKPQKGDKYKNRKGSIRQQLDIAFRSNVKRHNEKVAKNRYVLAKAERDSSLKDRLTSAAIFKRTSKEIQNDLLDCMLTVCQNHIKNEISKASFVSVIADETTDVSSICQLVVVYRYVLCNGQPVERFWGFKNPPGHDAKSIAECIQASLEKVVTKSEKLISQSYDGTNMMSGQHAGVQTFIQCAYKNAQYVHCYAHKLNLIVGQATSRNRQVRVFFSNLSDITNFFNKSPQRIAILDETVIRVELSIQCMNIGNS